MKKERIALKLFFLAFAIITILHTAIHFVSIEGKSIGVTEEGISGFTVGKTAIAEEILETYPIGASLSRIVVICEWLFVILFGVLLYLGMAKDFSKEVSDLNEIKLPEHNGYTTDLDRLYEMLKKKKRIGFGAIAKVFNVNQDLVKEWGETLEIGGLASVEYPRIGGAELILKESK